MCPFAILLQQHLSGRGLVRFLVSENTTLVREHGLRYLGVVVLSAHVCYTGVRDYSMSYYGSLIYA